LLNAGERKTLGTYKCPKADGLKCLGRSGPVFFDLSVLRTAWPAGSGENLRSNTSPPPLDKLTIHLLPPLRSNSASPRGGRIRCVVQVSKNTLESEYEEGTFVWLDTCVGGCVERDESRGM
jgi:hypothetical protein